MNLKKTSTVNILKAQSIYLDSSEKPMLNTFNMEITNREIKSAFTGNQINWNQVFYFCQIALYGSIKQASIHLGLSASTLSEHLAQLEKDLKVELFSRQHRKLSLTPTGSRLFQHAKQMFEAGQRLIDVVSPIPLGCYPVSVAMVPSSCAWLAYKVVSLYVEPPNSFSMKVSQQKFEEIERGLVDTKFDFGFSDRSSERKDIVSELIFSSPLRFYVSARWEGKKYGELFHILPLLYFNNDSVIRDSVERFLADMDIAPEQSITSEFPGLLLDLCAEGRGIGLFNSDSIEHSGSKDNLVALPLEQFDCVDKLYVLWAKGAENTDAINRVKNLLSMKTFLSKE